MNDDIQPQEPQVQPQDPYAMPQTTPPQMVPPQPQMTMPQVDIGAQLAAAKQALGIDELRAQLEKQQEAATYNLNLADVISTNPELSKKTIEEGLDKLAQTSPELAKQFKISREGLEIFVKGLKATVAPQSKPDPITNDGTSSADDAGEDETLKRIREGKARAGDVGRAISKLISK